MGDLSFPKEKWRSGLEGDRGEGGERDCEEKREQKLLLGYKINKFI